MFICLVRECISVIKRKWLKGVWSENPIQMEEGQKQRMHAANHTGLVRKGVEAELGTFASLYITGTLAPHSDLCRLLSMAEGTPLPAM